MAMLAAGAAGVPAKRLPSAGNLKINGLMTYDREVLKIPEEALREINAALHFDA